MAMRSLLGQIFQQPPDDMQQSITYWPLNKFLEIPKSEKLNLMLYYDIKSMIMKLNSISAQQLHRQQLRNLNSINNNRIDFNSEKVDISSSNINSIDNQNSQVDPFKLKNISLYAERYQVFSTLNAYDNQSIDQYYQKSVFKVLQASRQNDINYINSRSQKAAMQAQLGLGQIFQPYFWRVSKNGFLKITNEVKSQIFNLQMLNFYNSQQQQQQSGQQVQNGVANNFQAFSYMLDFPIVKLDSGYQLLVPYIQNHLCVLLLYDVQVPNLQQILDQSQKVLFEFLKQIASKLSSSIFNPNQTHIEGYRYKWSNQDNKNCKSSPTEKLFTLKTDSVKYLHECEYLFHRLDQQYQRQVRQQLVEGSRGWKQNDLNHQNLQSQKSNSSGSNQQLQSYNSSSMQQKFKEQNINPFGHPDNLVQSSNSRQFQQYKTDDQQLEQELLKVDLQLSQQQIENPKNLVSMLDKLWGIDQSKKTQQSSNSGQQILNSAFQKQAGKVDNDTNQVHQKNQLKSQSSVANQNQIDRSTIDNINFQELYVQSHNGTSWVGIKQDLGNTITACVDGTRFGYLDLKQFDQKFQELCQGNFTGDFHFV